MAGQMQSFQNLIWQSVKLNYLFLKGVLGNVTIKTIPDLHIVSKTIAYVVEPVFKPINTSSGLPLST